MLVNSYLYYKTEIAVVSDADWDKWAKELVQLQIDYPDIAEQVPYATEFATWDGTTGEFLPLNDEWVVRTAKHLIGEVRVPPKKSSSKQLKRKLF